MKNNKKSKITKNAKEADGLAKGFSEDMKLAVEAMRRTVRRRNTRAVYQDQYIYEQIM